MWQAILCFLELSGSQNLGYPTLHRHDMVSNDSKVLPCLFPTAHVDLVQSPHNSHEAICLQRLLSTSPPLGA